MGNLVHTCEPAFRCLLLATLSIEIDYFCIERICEAGYGRIIESKVTILSNAEQA